ncbi:MAG: ATP-binding protein [Bacteroidales bacterium]|nr:ATP-binding protein [Bacteroidales bacterium]
MYLKRHIDKYLADWKATPNHKPLIVKGARQTGKTVSIRQFAEANYEHFVEINFVENPQFKDIILDGYSPQAIMKRISLLWPEVKFTPGNTLIFFDELQEFPEIATALKFFNQDGNYDVICSGSLLGIHYKRIESVSVGYKIDYQMFSMDFEEYLWAIGYAQEVIDEMFEHLVKREPFSALHQDVFFSHFRDYCVIGGMPAAVAKFVENKNFQGILELQLQIIEDYKEDIRKYVEGIDQTRILNVYNRIPVQLAQENKKFQISKVASGAKTKDYWGCVEWLMDAGIINICYCMNFPELPLKGNYDPTKYKLYIADTGLLVAQLDEESQYDLRANKNLGTYKGGLYENIVAEAMVKAGMPLFYYKRQDSSLEIDFFTRDFESLIPIEVKANNNQNKSLKTVIESDKYSDIHWGIKLAMANIGFANNVLTIPYYCTFLLQRYRSYLKEKHNGLPSPEPPTEAN